jgi:hypothetical protein
MWSLRIRYSFFTYSLPGCVTACPNAVYDDGTNTFCYFLYSTDLASDKLDDAETLCSLYDPDATLAIVDSEAKQDHIASLGIFSGITV